MWMLAWRHQSPFSGVASQNALSGTLESGQSVNPLAASPSTMPTNGGRWCVSCIMAPLSATCSVIIGRDLGIDRSATTTSVQECGVSVTGQSAPPRVVGRDIAHVFFSVCGMGPRKLLGMPAGNCHVLRWSAGAMVTPAQTSVCNVKCWSPSQELGPREVAR